MQPIESFEDIAGPNAFHVGQYDLAALIGESRHSTGTPILVERRALPDSPKRHT